MLLTGIPKLSQYIFFNRRVLYPTPEVRRNPVFENWQKTSSMKGGIVLLITENGV